MALQVENICKSFGADVILQDVSLTASDNEKVGIIGPNGAGKSTLLKIIAGELSSDSGRIITPKGGAVGFFAPKRFRSRKQNHLGVYDERL